MQQIAAPDRQQPADHGFSLIEVLVTMTILAVGLFASASMFPVAYSDLAYSGHQTKAIALARGMLEMIKADSFPNLDSYNGVNTQNTATFPATTPPLANVQKWANDLGLSLPTGKGLPSGQGTIAVSTDTATLRTITVTVTWIQQNGQKTAVLTTKIAKTL